MYQQQWGGNRRSRKEVKNSDPLVLGLLEYKAIFERKLASSRGVRQYGVNNVFYQKRFRPPNHPSYQRL